MSREKKGPLRSVGGPSDQVTIAVRVLGRLVEIYDELAEKRDVDSDVLLREALEFYILAHRDAEAADALLADPDALAWIGMLDKVGMALDLIDTRNGREPVWAATSGAAREFVRLLREQGWVLRRVQEVPWGEQEPLEFDPDRGGPAAT